MPTTPPVSTETAIAEYERRRRLRQEAVDALGREERALSIARLLLFIAIVVLAWRGAVTETVSLWWCLVPILAFAVVVVVHARRIELEKRRERTVRYYARGLERLSDAWMGRGDGGADLLPPDHPYAADLDVFGTGSLFERLSVARTEAGRLRLAKWLTTDAEPDVVRARTEGVRELSPLLDLKEDLAVLGEDAARRVHPDRIRSWALAPQATPSRAWILAALLVGAGNVTAATTWALEVTDGFPFLITFALTLIVHSGTRRWTSVVVANVGEPARELELIATLAARFRREHVESPPLRALLERLDTNGSTLERAVRRLCRRAELVDSMRNPFFGPVAFFLLWSVHVSVAVDAWRRTYGHAVPEWLDAMADIEAFASVATYAWENPEDVVAETLAPSPSTFRARSIGHPLLPRATCRRNDVELSSATSLLIVSGSNMSGKSTLLRTVGVSVVLARIGAPVRAEALALSPLRVGASLRTQDSLLAGKSRFYAEIERLRLLVELAESGRLLFLVDEILQGTNSHDRRIGAEAVLEGLVTAGAIGLATTHDLALTDIAEGLGGRARNVHFADDMVDGTMVFDYTLRDGVVRRSNAIALMRSIGIRV